ncbi:NADH dehydrogenase subunit J [Bryobacterales bacterium F-183]|nr:NADH dehydrogenase subunit J [Bryobacterales bacterium F-183]
MDAILFFLFATITVICAINMVLQRHPISSALSLIGVMGSLAVLYLLLGGEFIAMAQLIVYSGAIMVLFLFVIMLLNSGAEPKRSRHKILLFLGAPLLVILLGVIGYFIQGQIPAQEMVKFGSWESGPGKPAFGSPQNVGMSLFTSYLLPFEITSVLILIAILGAIVLARKEID